MKRPARVHLVNLAQLDFTCVQEYLRATLLMRKNVEAEALVRDAEARAEAAKLEARAAAEATAQANKVLQQAEAEAKAQAQRIMTEADRHTVEQARLYCAVRAPQLRSLLALSHGRGSNAGKLWPCSRCNQACRS